MNRASFSVAIVGSRLFPHLVSIFIYHVNCINMLSPFGLDFACFACGHKEVLKEPILINIARFPFGTIECIVFVPAELSEWSAECITFGYCI